MWNARRQSVYPFDTSHDGEADHDRAEQDALYLLNAENWPSTRTPITAAMLGNLARAYIELTEHIA